MDLSNDRVFGVHALSGALNVLPETSSILRDLKVFNPVFLNTTYAEIEYQSGEMRLVASKARGSGGDPLAEKARAVRTYKIPHFPVDTQILADDVQNLRAFGTNDKLTAVADVVNDKLQDAKGNLEYTREHLQLGALLGKVIDKNGEILCDIHADFGITQNAYVWALDTASTEVGRKIDETKTAQQKLSGGFAHKGWLVLASPEFMQALVWHKSVKDIYMRYQEASALRADNTHITFSYKGIDFVQYDHQFAGDVNIAAGEAIWLPKGADQLFREYFAPADMNATVNTRALPYYAVREKLPMDKGWKIHAQTNALPLTLRPQVVAKLKVA